jgi:hypothetical protein
MTTIYMCHLKGAWYLNRSEIVSKKNIYIYIYIYIYIIINKKEAKKTVISLGLGSIKSGLCATCLLNKPFGETKLYLIIEHTYIHTLIKFDLLV